MGVAIAAKLRLVVAGRPGAGKGTQCARTRCIESPGTLHREDCEHCGGEMVRRDDDTSEAVLRRLAVYDAEAEPMVQWFADRAMLVQVDGHRAPDCVAADLVGCVPQWVLAQMTSP